nr:hypothetical protein BaRGS_002624 [Batillaria attramentaria]
MLGGKRKDVAAAGDVHEEQAPSSGVDGFAERADRPSKYQERKNRKQAKKEAKSRVAGRKGRGGQQVQGAGGGDMEEEEEEKDADGGEDDPGDHLTDEQGDKGKVEGEEQQGESGRSLDADDDNSSPQDDPSAWYPPPVLYPQAFNSYNPPFPGVPPQLYANPDIGGTEPNVLDTDEEDSFENRTLFIPAIQAIFDSNLGWIVNLEKSDLTPSQDFVHLGVLNAAADLVPFGRLRLRPIQMALLAQWRPATGSLGDPTFGKPLIDLFATRWNCKLPTFISPVPDPPAWACDALATSWENMIGYAYPPTCRANVTRSEAKTRGALMWDRELSYTWLKSKTACHSHVGKTQKELQRDARYKSQTTLAHRYHPSSKECSVMSCLHQFTAAELLTDKKGSDQVYSNASKQFLILVPPAILTLHLKRFEQVGYTSRKVNRHVEFPTILDIAPYCSSLCQDVRSGQRRVLYSLYGVVEHSGRLSGGHYTAYVKCFLSLFPDICTDGVTA